MIVLDASALLAFLFRERGHAAVAIHLHQCFISSVNLSEVLGRFARDGLDVIPVAERLAPMAEVVPFSANHALIAAALIPKVQALGLGIGDRACLSLAIERKLPVLTADRIWAKVDAGVEIQLIR